MPDIVHIGSLVLGAAWQTLGEMAPYLLFGFACAGALSMFLSPAWVEAHLGGQGWKPVFKAAALGVPLPLCSCGVLPVAASLRQHGASAGATTAFLIATPQTGVDSILVTYSLLGPVFAIFRPVAALVSGLLGGMLLEACDRTRLAPTPTPAACAGDCCARHGPRPAAWRRALRHGFITLPRDLGPSLLLGVGVAGLIGAFVPEHSLAAVAGGGLGAMLLMLLFGIPLYVCATASVPIAAALIAKGVSPGAAMVFLMTGPATNAAAIVAIWRMMGVRATVVYLGTVAVSALLCGAVLDWLLVASPIAATAPACQHLPSGLGPVSAVALLAVLVVSRLPSARARHPVPSSPSRSAG